jgi:hypothetical protein
MAGPYELKIPEDHWPYIKAIANMPLQQLEALADCMLNAEPTRDVEDLVEKCAATVSVSQDTVEAILVVALNLSRFQRTMDASSLEILQSVSSSMSAMKSRTKWTDKESEAWKEREPILEKLFVTDGVVEIMSKVRELLYDFQSILLGSAVLTDVRHVYNHDATEIKGALVVQTLSLELLEGRQRRQVYAALSSDEIDRLILQLQRAKSKARVAETNLKEMNVSELTPKRSR